MVTLNPDYRKVKQSYLFSEITKRTKAFQASHPDAKIIRLGIGNTTEPLPEIICDALENASRRLGKRETYSGYGDEQGNSDLREAISKFYAKLGLTIPVGEIFVSDGAKSDLGNLMQIFEKGSVIAVQDPVYPAYVDTATISGHQIITMPCTPQNQFFPEMPKQPSVIYFCSPNNPTGAVASRSQLEQLVDHAMQTDSVVVFDAAYSPFISDPKLPRSIYEIEGAKKCAIEINSFSKSAGFTGVRLGWTVVPKDLVVSNTKEGEANAVWNRRQTTFFNGASNIAQAGGLAVLTNEGQEACQKVVDYYKNNASMIRAGLGESGITVYGGRHAPYIWAQMPNGMKSWDAFDKFLTEANVVVTPGSGFGSQGEGFVRFSAFGHQENVQEAIERVKKLKF